MHIVGFTFEWLKGSRNDNCIVELKRRMIPYCYIMQRLHVQYGNKWLPVSYSRVRGDLWRVNFGEE